MKALLIAVLMFATFICAAQDTIPPPPKDHILTCALRLEQAGREKNAAVVIAYAGLAGGALFLYLNEDDPAGAALIAGSTCAISLVLEIDGNTKITKAGKQLRRAREKGLL